MKNDEFVTINEMFRRFKGFNRFYTLFDKLTFFHIFSVWALIIIAFGAGYSFLNTETSFLTYGDSSQKVYSLFDSIYFSFITATSTGFGDIVPHGLFKIVAILEVIFGLLLLAFVTSKLISIKQDAILSEIYEISFNERVSRIRASLLLFRQNLNRVIDKIEDGTIRKREINDLYIHISSLEDILNEVLNFFWRGVGTNFTKVIDSLNTELVFNSVIGSFEKIDELIKILNNANIEWRRDITLSFINRCIAIQEDLFRKLNSMKNLNDKKLADLNAQKDKAVDSIKSKLGATINELNI